MNSGKNSMTEIQAEEKSLNRMRICLVLLIAVPLLLGGLFFAIAYYCDVAWLYLLSSAMGLTAIALGGKAKDLKFQIEEKEKLIRELR